MKKNKWKIIIISEIKTLPYLYFKKIWMWISRRFSTDKYTDDDWYDLSDEIFFCKYNIKKCICMQPIDVLFEIYREAYRKSEPSVDFDELYKHAKETGEKIPFEEYYLPDKEYKKIVDKWLNKKYKMIDDYHKKQISFEAYLGCGPVGSKKSWKRKVDGQ